MKILALCDAQGDVQSVVIPNPRFADRIGLEPNDGGSVHHVEIDSRRISREMLLGVKGEAAQKKAYAALRTMIQSKPRPEGKKR